jgi:hypothetical protein
MAQRTINILFFQLHRCCFPRTCFVSILSFFYFFLCVFSVEVKSQTVKTTSSTELYIAVNGNDNNPGTLQKPLASIAKARNLARANKSIAFIYLRAGNYYLKEPVIFSAADSRSDGESPLIYKPYAEDKVKISGGLLLKLKWEKHSVTILKAKIQDPIVIEQLFVNGKLQPMARYPNFDSSAKYYNGYAADAISPERVATWADPSGGFIHSLHKHEWGGFHSQITEKDSGGNLKTIGGWQNNRQMGMHEKVRFVENIREELDTAGEWFYAAKEKTLYFYPPANLNLTAAIFEAPQIKSLFEFRGSEKAPVKNISIEGFELTHTLRTFMETKEPLLRSDWAIYRGAAVVFEGTQNCSVKKCFINSVGGNAVFVTNYNRNTEISGCHISNAGGNGICFVGNPSAVRSPSFEYNKFVPYDKIDKTPGPQNNNYPAQCIAKNNLIENIGRIEKQAAGVQISMSMDISIHHNTIYDVPRAGINIGDGCWGGHDIAFNDVFNTVLETGDHGAFNSWGRDRFWHPVYDTIQQIAVKDPGLILADVIRPITIRNNRFRCDNGWDIDLDDGSSNYQVYNNLTLNGGIKLREGFYRTVKNNVIVNNSLHPHVWFAKSYDTFTGNIMMDEYKPIQLRGWGELIDRNFFIDSLSLGKARSKGTDMNSKSGDPLFVNPSEGDFRVKDQSDALKIGFVNFSMDQFGVLDQSLKEKAKKPVLPRQLYTEMVANKEMFVEWIGATIKKLSGLGERSATGMDAEKGVYVVAVAKGSKAERYGIKPNDVILKVDSKETNNTKDVIAKYNGALWKGAIDIVLFSQQNERTIKIKND